MSLVNLEGPTKSDKAFVRLDSRDNVVIARLPLQADSVIVLENREIRIRQAIGPGHKIAVRNIPEGNVIRKYGENIGTARKSIRIGELIHVHNLLYEVKDRQYEFANSLSELSEVPLLSGGTFMGYQRADGRVGTRNCVAVVGASNCAAHTVQRIEAAFRRESFEGTGIDTVVCFPHADGCGQSAGTDTALLRRTLDGLADHPNVAAAVVVGLGCEVNQVSFYLRPDQGGSDRDLRRGFTVQESGGTRRVVEDGVKAVWELIEEVGHLERVECSASKLVVALECGGSDAFSGIAANPAVGYCSDLLVKRGGTVCLGETPEIYGAEHLLTRRAVSREVGEKLLAKIDWYKRYVAGFLDPPTFNSNPSPGNRAGGLTNIVEKSLGAAAKAGTSPLTEVYDYAERIDANGFVFMNTPGYDPTSVTGMAAGGCNVCLFTTGRGSCFGFPTVPVVKIASNSQTGKSMDEDMDVDTGAISEGTEDIKQAGERIYRFLLETASGRKTFSEVLGHREFVPWRIGPVL